MRPIKVLNSFDNSSLPVGLYSICEQSKAFEWIFKYERSIKFEAVVLKL